MPFELTEALMDDILFSMENQAENFFLDTTAGVISGGLDEIPDPERYISLPEWDSASGFRLMERFTAAIRNPLIREELSAALNRGRGVFRAFKDTLEQRPETEKVWFAFKEREMKREIIRWYNALREEWGLRRIGEEPEETGDLVLEDFRFRQGLPEDRAAAEALHALCLREQGNCTADDTAGGSESSWTFPGDRSFTVETVGGDFAGYIAALKRGTVLHIRALELRPEYRGLGIGETLLARIIADAGTQGITRIHIDLPTEAEGFSRVLLRESFKPCVVRYCRDMEQDIGNL
ncbi:MAG: GNAT family N-acetyltransferase [Treponema sp.]|jgi:GNAT superfamily N-acetyltransferase|nr:GNAT family N-acetyltransferase [Treponema sp.]